MKKGTNNIILNCLVPFYIFMLIKYFFFYIFYKFYFLYFLNKRRINLKIAAQNINWLFYDNYVISLKSKREIKLDAKILISFFRKYIK